MSKYIEFTDAVKVMACEMYAEAQSQGYVPEATAWMNDAPSIDIVRCKECKEWDKNDHECYLDRGGLYFPNADDFCSYGEREGE